MSTPGTYRWNASALILLTVELLAWGIMLMGWWLLDTQVPAFRFEKPEVLRYLLAGPVMVLIFLLDLAWRNRALRRFASDPTRVRTVPGVSNWRIVLRFLLIRHGLAFVLIALAAPQYGTRIEEVKAEGIDLVVAVDVSNSMGCEDLKPSRMEAARRAMSQLIDQLHGDRLGIVVFAGDAFVQLPITVDRSAAKLFLSTVGMNSVGTQGTAIGAAIELAQRSFDKESAASKAIIVITDGENHEDDALGAARDAAQEGIVVHTVGMGTVQGGPLPIRHNGQVTGFRKDREGNTVVSRLDEDMLRRIAAEGNGVFVRATDNSSGITELVEQLKSLDKTEVGTYRFASFENQYQWPLGIGSILILLGMALGEQRNTRRRWSGINA
ncbi:MAG TPA: VWA domain-containing protein [Flavobacteriales bacterium]|nr:VWA domain-containing protein [Flavobacteriales bacterium]